MTRVMTAWWMLHAALFDCWPLLYLGGGVTALPVLFRPETTPALPLFVAVALLFTVVAVVMLVVGPPTDPLAAQMVREALDAGVVDPA